MGEIGYNRQEYLYDLTYCDIICIERGYYKRYRNLWSSQRWQTFNIMGCWSDLKSAGIHRPIDLLRFPWEKVSAEDTDESEDGIPSMEQAEEMRRQMREYNNQINATNK